MGCLTLKDIAIDGYLNNILYAITWLDENKEMFEILLINPLQFFSIFKMNKKTLLLGGKLFNSYKRR